MAEAARGLRTWAEDPRLVRSLCQPGKVYNNIETKY